MCSHSEGDVVGASILHTKVYRREEEYYRLLDASAFDPDVENLPHTRKVMKLTDMQKHYVSLYIQRNREVKEFFAEHNPQALFTANLEDKDKWVRLGAFLGFEVSPDYSAHANRSAKK